MLKIIIRMIGKEYYLISDIIEDMGFYFGNKYDKTPPTNLTVIPVNHRDDKVSVVIGYYNDDELRLGWTSGHDFDKAGFRKMSAQEFVRRYAEDVDKEIEPEPMSIYEFMCG